MIRLEAVTKVFHAGQHNEYRALDGISATIEAGRATVLMGPSGSGKTSLLSIVGCMSRPTSGRVWLHERELTSLPERFLTEVRRKTFGFIFQRFNLIGEVSALENAMLPLYPLGLPHARIHARVMELFERLGIAHRAQARAKWLSGGEAQRVAVARALVNDPDVIIADEPTAHLDTALSLELVDILLGLKAMGKTLIMTSHDPLVTRSGEVDALISIRDGRIEPPGGPHGG